MTSEALFGTEPLVDPAAGPPHAEPSRPQSEDVTGIQGPQRDPHRRAQSAHRLGLVCRVGDRVASTWSRVGRSPPGQPVDMVGVEVGEDDGVEDLDVQLAQAPVDGGRSGPVSTRTACPGPVDKAIASPARYRT